MTDHDDRAPAWRYEQHDTLHGEIVELATWDAGWGEYPIVVIADSEGTRHAWHAYHAVAVAQLAKQKPSVGERIEIEYLGKVPAKTEGRKPYHSWKVALPDRPTEVDWSALAKAAGVPADEPAAKHEPEKSSQLGPDDDLPF